MPVIINEMEVVVQAPEHGALPEPAAPPPPPPPPSALAALLDRIARYDARVAAH